MNILRKGIANSKTLVGYAAQYFKETARLEWLD